MLPSGRSPFIRIVCTILVLLCGAAAQAQQCEPPIGAPQISVPPQVCPYRTADASILPPAEGSWPAASWSITNGFFVDALGNTVPYANGENIHFQADGNGPVTLAVYAEHSSGCTTSQGTAEVAIRTIPPPQLSVPPQVCPWTTATASVLPPAEGTWVTVGWGITNGQFVDNNGNTVPYANGETIRFQANGDGPVTLYAYAEDSFGCNTMQGTAEVPIRTIPPPQLSVPPQVCPWTTATASVLPPAEGTWVTVGWGITNGQFVDGNGNTVPYANGETIRFQADGNGPVTLYAYAEDSFGCNTMQGTAEVPIRTIPPPQLSVPPQVCPWTTATASVLPPAEGTWVTVGWGITNGQFVDNNGNTVPYANGETIRFQANGDGPVTLYAYAEDSFGCNTMQGTAEVPIRTIPPPQLSVPPQVCPWRPATASVLPPAEGTWVTVGWGITNGQFVDNNGNTVPYAYGENIHFQADGNGPVTLYAYAEDSFGCNTMQGTAEVPLRTIDPPHISAPAQVCTSAPATASLLPPAEGTWMYVSWSIIGGTFLDAQGNTIPYANGETVRFVASGSEPVELFASAEDSFGCHAMQGTVTIPTVPGGGPLPSITLSSPGICGTEPVTASVDNAFSSYAWTVTNADITAGEGTNEITFVANGDGPVTVSVETSSGACTATDSETVYLTGEPALLWAPISACTGALLKASTANWYSGFSWTATNATIEGPSDGRELHFRPTGAGPVVISLEALNYTGCFVRNSVTVSLDGYPVPEFSFPRGYSMCPGRESAVQAADYYESYNWTVTNATITSGQGTPLVEFVHTIGAGNVGVTLNVGEGACSASESTTITVLPSPGPMVAELAAPGVCALGTGTLYFDNYSDYPSIYTYVTNGSIIGISAGRVPGGRTYTFRNDGGGPTTIKLLADSNCQVTKELTAPMLLAATAYIVPSDPTTFCQGGSVTLTANGGGASYLWSTGATTQSITVNASGNYAVTVTNANGCSKTSTPVTVTVNPVPATPVIAPSGPTTFCAGGSVTLTAPAAASYLWSNGATTQSITVSASGSYGVTVTNANGCGAQSAPAVVTVNANPATPVITPSGPTTFCQGGSVTLTAPAAAAYLWSNGATTQSIVVSASGSHSVTVTNAGGCSATTAPVTATVIAPPATPVITPSGPTTFCEGGSVTLTAPAATSYHWSNGATTQSIVVSTSGTYLVMVMNANGCAAQSAPAVVTVNATPATPVVTPSGPTTFCEGGSVTLTAPAAASYLWSNGETSQSIVASASGPYSVTVTNASGCSATSAVTNVVANAMPETPVVTPSGPTTFCEGGSVTLTAPLSASYAWSNGAATRSITVNASGSYSVTVTNNQGCTAASAATAVTVNPVPATPVITPGGPTTFCAGGSVTLTAPASASYLWSNGATTQSIVVTASGSYSVTVTNESGCSKSSAATNVVVNPVPSATITPSGPTTFCDGGSVTLTAPLNSSYLWSTGATTRSIGVSASGTFTVTVTNASGCTATSAPVTVTENVPVKPAITASATNVCPGTSVTLTSSEAVSYRWSTGATTRSITFTPSSSTGYWVFATDANGCEIRSDVMTVFVDTSRPTITVYGNPAPYCDGEILTLGAPDYFPPRTYLWSTGATTRTIQASAPGTYTVTTTTTNGCSATSDPVVLNAETPTATVSGTDAVCPGQPATIQADLTGTGPWNVTWSDGVTQTGITTSPATRVVAPSATTTYTLTAFTDANCTGTRSGFATVTVNAAAANITAGGPTTFCEGGSVTLTASAGESYLWSTGATAQSIAVNASGSYSVTVTNASGCSTTSAATNVTVNANPVATIAPGGPTTFCAGGSVTLTASAGSSYLWSNGATTQSINATASGSYSVTVTNAAGCSTTSAATSVTVNANPPATITAGGPTTFCAGGSVTLTASAGTSYLWSNGATTQSINTTTSGSYTVTVSNAAGCSATSAATAVTVNANPTATITAGGPTTFCEGGSVTLTASAGSSYLWSNGATTQSINATASGSYTVTVTNAAGCSTTSAATAVTVNANPTATITAGGPTTFCEGGSVTLTASAGSSYLWSNGATTQSINATASGSYTVTVTNAAGCSTTSAATAVTVNANPIATIAAGGPTTFCEGGSVTLTASAGSSYLWSNGATTQSINATASGSYTVTVTNAAGCSTTSAATAVTVNANPAATITAGGPTTFCQGGSVTLTASAGTSYLWSNGATTQAINVTAAGSYSVTVTNANGCSATSAATAVTVNANPTATITPSGPTTFCQGGSVTLTASAGSSYLWSTGATTQSIAVSASGSYSVTVTNASGCSTTSAPTGVTVNANPATPAITPSGPTTFCAGGSVTLTASAGASYLWSTGATTQSIAVSASGSYSVTVGNASGCTTTSAATAVTVNPLPAVPVITPGGSTALCPGASVTLTAPASTSYLWSTGATTQSIVVSAAGSYSVTVTNASGCSRTSAPVSVTANPPTVITTHPLTQTMPRNTTRVLSVAATGTATLQYQWYQGASGNTSTPVAGQTASTMTIGPYSKKGTFQFWVRVTSTGCPGSSANSNTATITVN